MTLRNFEVSTAQSSSAKKLIFFFADPLENFRAWRQGQGNLYQNKQ